MLTLVNSTAPPDKELEKAEFILYIKEAFKKKQSCSDKQGECPSGSVISRGEK